MKRTESEWRILLEQLGVRPATAAYHAPAFAELCTPEAFSLGRDEMDDFLAQIVHESAHLERLTENLNYTAQRLCAVWPRRFPTLQDALPYAGAPMKLAEKVYGGRGDLGNDQPGDGARYIGRGLIMVTGRSNYELVQAATGDPVVDNPVLLATPRISLKSAIAWWEKRIPDSIVGNVDLVSRRVNGGAVGLEERRRLATIANRLV